MARAAGALYLAYVLANIVASRLGHIGLSDADTMRRTAADHQILFRWGLVAAMLSALLFVLTAWALYALLREVDERLALLVFVLNAVGVAVQCASYLPLLSLLVQDQTTGLTGRQLDGLAMQAIATHQTGFVTAQIFFSAWLFPLGWLVLRSRLFPKFVGWLLLLDGVGVFAWFLQVLLAPDHPAISYPSWAIGFLVEVGFALGLVIKSVPARTPDTTDANLAPPAALLSHAKMETPVEGQGDPG